MAHHDRVGPEKKFMSWTKVKKIEFPSKSLFHSPHHVPAALSLVLLVRIYWRAYLLSLGFRVADDSVLELLLLGTTLFYPLVYLISLKTVSGFGFSIPLPLDLASPVIGARVRFLVFCV